jgi:hypothetical protein
VSDQRFLCPKARMISGGFPVRRGADAGHIVAISDENEFEIRPPNTRWKWRLDDGLGKRSPDPTSSGVRPSST